MTTTRTQVGIVGAGPAGLTLGHLLHRAGIEAVVLERRSQDYVEARIRAGVLEHDVAELFADTGIGERMRREGLVHTGVEIQSGRERHRIAFDELTGKSIVVYGQTEIVKDLIDARVASGAPLHFEVADVSLHELESEGPRIRFTHEGEPHELDCDIVAGCDGFHGVSRPAIPGGVLREYSREYPFGWLGVLAAVAPSSDELVYAHQDRGFALLSMRSPELSRLYLQCAPDEDLAAWPDDRIWEELQARLGVDGWTLHEGPILEKGVTPMRSFVAEPMQWGRLYLAGDAAHIVPPTGAKGLNLAVRDVHVLADALVAWYRDGDRSLLDAYSETCLRRVWRAEHFSWWMTTMLHRRPDGDEFDLRLQRSQLRYLQTSRVAATSLAENYVGIERV
ncbi:4-hydroxybenzoate 3-monooxygenase [Gaiella sp.]|jgi:p-hydroxybenzoate 3-monooxygenase|uniref:4-hydroxybenzoate 3-monooxygenase n=1 Tax=Gaiella sp. TaxID=2663207 RepID=UPI002E357376|nr:4-hydroxybenzoate 3-monooxygenase [Gaiella sp.]HEX5583383.1 4-hydroxybenzoate 3-monooxygenase [Gaiella sp.]